MEVASPLGEGSDRETQSSDFEDSKTASDNSMCMKFAAAAALAGISYDFG
jgi:hypothetical protein